MKTHLLTWYWRLLAVVAVAFLGSTPAFATLRLSTLEAIHQLENPLNLTRPGKYGELGAYQFRSHTWRMHTDQPFRHALDRSVSDAVAVKHYEWLKSGLERAGVAPTPYNIALAWNGGLSAAVRGRAPRAAHQYAQRAANLTAEFDAKRRVASAR